MIVINPIVGGGLSNSKLALATATAADVVAGKTFYAGSKTLKTGTLKPQKVVTGSTWWSGEHGGLGDPRTLTVSTGLREITNIAGHWHDDNSSYQYSFFFFYDAARPSDTYGRFTTTGGNSRYKIYGLSALTITGGQFIITLSDNGYTNDGKSFRYIVTGY